MNRLLDFKSFFKFLGRNKAYTFIDVFGLSVSLMFVLLIALYTTQELSTDKQHTKADRIYLVGNDSFLATGAAIPYMIKERYPEVEKVCPVVVDNGHNGVVAYKDRRRRQRDVRPEDVRHGRPYGTTASAGRYALRHRERRDGGHYPLVVPGDGYPRPLGKREAVEPRPRPG